MSPKPRHAKPAPAAVVPAAAVPAVSERTLSWLIVAVLFLLPFLFYGKYLTGSSMLFGTDWLGAGGYAIREFMRRYVAEHGWIAYWMPQLLCGQPTGAAFFADLFYPTFLARMVLPVHVVWTWTFTTHLFLAGLGTFLFLRELKVSQLPAALAGVAYMFAGSLVTLTYAGHDGRLIGSALLPLALFCLHRGMTRERLVWFVLTGLVLGLQLLSGHIQKVYYTGLLLFAYFVIMLISAIRSRKSAGTVVKLCLFFLVGLGFAGALSAIQYLPIYGNMAYASRGSERGYEYASSWSMPVIETFDLLTPRFSGGLDSYWGRNPFKLHSEYLGVLPLLFACVAVLRRWRDRSVRFFAFSAGIGLLMAWGGNTPFYRIPFYLLPGISKFRGPAMIFFLVAFSIVALAGLGIDHLLHEMKAEQSRRTSRTILIVSLVPVLLLVVFAAFKDAMLGLLRSGTLNVPQKLAALETSYPSLLSGLLMAAAIAVVGLFLAWLLLRRRAKPLAFAIVVAAVLVLDSGLSLRLWDESKGYIRGVPPPAQYFAADDVSAFLARDTSLFRVLPLNYERSDDGELLLAGVQSTGGQMPNPLQSYQDFTGAGQSVMFSAGNLLRPNFTNLANVKYVISYTLPDDASGYSQRDQQAIAQLRAVFADSRFLPVHRGERYTVYQNQTVLPRAFVTPSCAVVKDKDEVLALLSRPDFSPSSCAVLYDSVGFVPQRDYFSGFADVTAYEPNRVAVRTHASAPALLVLSESYHPDYRAWLDGRPTKVLRAYHTFRAVSIPAGDHEVVFRYDSPWYRFGAVSTISALAFLVGVLVFSGIWRRRPMPRS